MKLIVASSYPLTRKGIISMIKKESDIVISGEANTVKSALNLIDSTKPDIIITDEILGEGNGLELFLKARLRKIPSKFIFIGYYNSIDFFIKSIDEGVEGYILREAEGSELLYAIRQVYKGRRYYDVDLMTNAYQNHNNQGVAALTARENEILIELGRGKTNRQISEDFYITEHTVKKHVSEILRKLGFNDRTQAAIYANNEGLILR